jgi:ATP-binding cassette subfamily C protein LapB
MIEIFNRLKNKPNLFVQILIASLFVNLFALATPIYVIQVLQRYVAYGVTSTLITLIAGIIFISIFEFFFRNIRHRMTREIEEENITLADKVLKKLTILKTSIYSLRNQFNSEAISGHVLTVQNIITATTTLILIDVPFVSIFLIALYLIHYQLGIIATIIIIIPFIISRFYSAGINKKSFDWYLNSMNISKLYENTTARYVTIRYFNLIDALKKSWVRTLNNTVDVKEKLEAEKNLLTSLMSSTSTFMTIVIIGWGAVLAVNGDISVGALIGANILASRAIAPIIRYVQTLEPLSKSDKSLQELNSLIALPHELQSGTEIKDFVGRISLNNLQFRYPSNKNPIFEKLSINIMPNQLTVIKGANGAGKSTLINVLTGIMDYEKGQLFFDDIEISQLSLSWLRKNLTYLPQEPKFIDGTLLDNIIGAREISKNDFQKVIQRIGLEDLINSDPNGVNLVLSNKGENLPVGIRKRIALGRALFIGGKLVIMDEPTEGLDEAGRNSVYQVINELVEDNKTVIVATQDEELMSKAKNIIDLDKKPVPEIQSIN